MQDRVCWWSVYEMPRNNDLVCIILLNPKKSRFLICSICLNPVKQ